MSPLVVLPSYNESENIVPLVREILGLQGGISVCVVDDSSPDGTAERIRSLQRELPAEEAGRVHLIVRPGKDGRGGAVRTGIEWGLSLPRVTPFDAFVEMDCDFSHAPSDIPRGLALLAGADVAMGCRYPDGTIVGWPVGRRVLSFCANLLARAVISPRIPDYTNGFRFYTLESARRMCAVPQRHTGYIYLSETAAAFLRDGLTIRFFPIRFVNRRRGESNTTAREVASALTGIFRIAWRHRFGRS